MYYVNKNEILIEQKHLIDINDLENENLERLLKTKFIEILKENAGLIIKSSDLKKRYLDELIGKGINIELLSRSHGKKNYVQIFKNLTGSNIKNSTHLLRESNINWFYGKGKTNIIDEIYFEKINTTDLPTNFLSNRRHGRNYFLFYNTVDSISEYEKELKGFEQEYNYFSGDEHYQGNVINESTSIVRDSKLQSIFRNNCISKDKSECAIEGCNISDKRLLIASHIVPFNKLLKDENLSEEEKIKLMISSSNGLLLCPNHDALVDKHFITFNKEGRILFHKKLSKEVLESLRVSVKTRLKVHRRSDDELLENFELVRKIFNKYM